MKLLSHISIRSFRSIGSAVIQDLGDFTAIAGLNNAGKSNVLRALNAFFSGKTDADLPLMVDVDYYRPHLNKRKAKKISVTVGFSLPGHFKFPKSIAAVEELLGERRFNICKSWV